MFAKKITIIVLLLVLIINNNFAYSIDQHNVKIETDSFDIYKFTEHLIVSDINSETKELVFEIPPVYDLIIKINNVKYTDFLYTTDKLIINLSSFSIPENKQITIDLIYLTDYYTSKQDGIWKLFYNPKYATNINSLEITLPKNSKLNNTSLTPSSIETINNSLVLRFNDIKNVTVGYTNKSVKTTSYYLSLIMIIFGLIVIIAGLVFIKKKKIKSKTITPNKNTTEGLLLGLNENEQKIIKIIMENEGQSQKIITAKSFLPKGTVSRNIQKLVDKGYIDIKKYGVSNKLFLGEVFKKGENK